LVAQVDLGPKTIGIDLGGDAAEGVQDGLSQLLGAHGLIGVEVSGWLQRLASCQ
jgi:hypothetical protein